MKSPRQLLQVSVPNMSYRLPHTSPQLYKIAVGVEICYNTNA